MSLVFENALALLFADPNIGRDAVYSDGGGAPRLARIVARRSDAITDFAMPGSGRKPPASTCVWPRFQSHAPAIGSRLLAMRF